MGGKMKKLLQAFEDKDISTINLMVTHGHLDPNMLIPDKGVSLFHLIMGNQSENFAFKVTKLFLRYGGDPNTPSTDGVTPTHVAAAWGRTRILHLLLVNGADPWLQDDDRKNAFNYAFEEQEWEAVEMLHHFQRMHFGANSRRDLGEPKFEFDLERVLLRTGQEIFSYVPDKLANKCTIETQTDELNYLSPCSSPVHDIIKQFEISPSLMSSSDELGSKKQKTFSGWCKDFYQTSCEVVVHSDEKAEEHSSPPKDKPRCGETAQTDSSGDHVLVMDNPKVSSNTSPGDVRSQLFSELREAVLRRTQRRTPASPPAEKKSEFATNISIMSGIEPFDDVREVSCLHGVNLKHPKDTCNLRNETEVIDLEQDKTIDLCTSSAYVTCDEGTELKIVDKPVVKPVVIHRRSVSFDPSDEEGIKHDSSESFVSMTEEYRYTDLEEGVILVEKKLLITPTISLIEDEDDIMTDDASSVASSASSVPSTLSYASDCLRYELAKFGCNPGPVTSTTKRLYLKKLWKLKKANGEQDLLQRPVVPALEKYAYSDELEKTVQNTKHLERIPSLWKLEEEMCKSFVDNTKRKWREGNCKSSFNYLLLDSRVSQNLPKRATGLTTSEVWQLFLSSVFYVGKGKSNRPYAHLYQAFTVWGKPQSTLIDKKVQHILDIWNADLGVVCLHVFHNVIPVEAFTREAAMIDAMGLDNLKNIRPGEYYGAAATWPAEDKLKLGVYLLYKSMQIFLNEGERQIRPYEIG